MVRSNLKIGNLQWRKARRSANNGACVEVAPANGKVLIRDSKDQGGSVLQCPALSWRGFVTEAKTGRFDPASFQTS
jgi:hypothetical protein